MNCVENAIYYHIQQVDSRHAQWQKGSTYFIGKMKNPFLAYYDSNGHYVFDSSTNKHYCINEVAISMTEYLITGNKNAKLSSFYHYDINKTLVEVSTALAEYLKLTREIIFEEVRKDFFPNLPSRHRCIWVIPDDANAIKYWWGQLGKNKKILKLSLAGKIFKTNQYHLTGGTNPLDELRQQAFKYWSGISGKDCVEDELLFEGFATVLDEVSPAVFGLT